MKELPSKIKQKLDERKHANAFRVLMDADHLTDFFSNDYLGIAKWSSESHFNMGSTGSRLISGNRKRTEEIEAQLAQFFHQEAGLLFNSGYDANLGLFSSVPQKGDTVIYDELIHASIRDGIRIGLASSFSFKHNDIKDIKDKVDRANGHVYVAVEAIYSMDGDASPLAEIAQICNEKGAFLIVDEAHSGGVFGEKGTGLVSDLKLDDQVFAKVITFGKAYGSHGAIVFGHNELKDYLVNFARSLIYTTALSPHAQERILEVVLKAADMHEERKQLFENIRCFKDLLSRSNVELIQSDSPIQCLLVKGNDDAKKMAERILKSGFAVKAILSPTVPNGKERIRFCLHSYNTENEIKELSKLIHV
ncbi:MAG: 8-amino-7-oxononanoate synthase [Crocinitomicaceae bacterium]|nr:8-amino-7-oxononanoate synthase [Crocinitomicaceae bacterium]